MRANRVIREVGYDGEYGAIKLFKPEELKTQARLDLPFSGGPF
jgi:hypothetical protein